MPDDDALGLVPVLLTEDVPVAESISDHGIELVLGDVRICVASDFDPEHLGRVIAVLKVSP